MLPSSAQAVLVRLGGKSRLFSPKREFHSSAAVAAAWWKHIQPAPKDPILGVTEAYLADPHPDKINLGVGAYRDENGHPLVLDCVREAERRIAGKEYMEYSPLGGLEKFNQLAIKLAYGEDSPSIAQRSIASLQTLSGTGACRLFAEFQKRFHTGSHIYVPNPTWSNHLSIWRDAGVITKPYRYYDPTTRSLDFSGLLEDVQNAPENSFFLLHACAHNPTGVDPSPEQWKEISAVFKKKDHFALFDMAYQGFASGDTERDAQAIRIFLNDGHQIACAQSFAKNMGLYGQRIGCLSVVCDSEAEARVVKSQIQAITRPMYSNPPVHGSMLVSIILGDPELRSQWHKEVKGMADRIIKMREELRSRLESTGSKLDWNHITDQIGMFCFSGMLPEQVDRLTKDHHIYLTRNGRISMAGVTSRNVEQLAHAIHEVTREADKQQMATA